MLLEDLNPCRIDREFDHWRFRGKSLSISNYPSQRMDAIHLLAPWAPQALRNSCSGHAT